eukprot:1315346-Pyramimonas_sp.AAC.1
MTELWGSTWGDNVQDVVVGAAQSDVALRKLLELHKKSSDRDKPFCLRQCLVENLSSAGRCVEFLEKTNPWKIYEHPLYDPPLP